MNCSKCDFELPDNAIFCPMCVTQVRCKSCHEALILGARGCMMCGALMGDNSSHAPADKSNGALIPAPNKIGFVETDRRRSFQAELTDVAIQHVGDSLGLYMSGRKPVGRPLAGNSAKFAEQAPLALPGMSSLSEDEGYPQEDSCSEDEEGKTRAGLVSTSLPRAAGGTIADMCTDQYPEVLKATQLVEKVLHVLKIARDDLATDGLSAPQIAGILASQFRIAATRQGVASALDRAGDMVFRTTSEKGSTIYRLMAAGEEYLANPTLLDKKVPRKRTNRRKTTSKSTSHGAGSNGAEQASSDMSPRPTQAKRTGSRPGPMAVIKDLIGQGFFLEAKNITQTQTYLQDQRGYQYGANELSPAFTRLTRNRDLNRSKQEDGQYEYTSA